MHLETAERKAAPLTGRNFAQSEQPSTTTDWEFDNIHQKSQELIQEHFIGLHLVHLGEKQAKQISSKLVFKFIG